VTNSKDDENTGRDNELWQQCWRDRDTDFHQTSVNHHLIRFWPGLDLPRGARIFVPLCGKSLDLLWLASQGHPVVGVELSPLAIRAFFKESRIQPSRRKDGRFTRWQGGDIEILCGDFFDLSADDLGPIAAVFDRAALTALPEDLRVAYLRQLRRIVPAACQIMLLTTEEPEDGENREQPFAIAEEISSLYGLSFDIELSDVASFFENDPDPAITELLRVEQKVYRLTPKSAI
jgi:thiopurine S-methyltransferase